MKEVLNQLPDDIESLKSLVVEQVLKLTETSTHNKRLAAQNQRYKADKQAVVQKNKHLKTQILTLQEQLNLALARRYAASSEKINPNQYRLFDEAETDQELPPEDAEVIVPAHTRKKGGRKKLPKTLPRVEVVYELSTAERICPHDGATLAEIGEVTSEQLDIVPAKIQVIRHIRKQYACACGQCIRTAALPNQPIPKSMASPGLLAHISVSKYQDALPLYRQETILRRIGVEIPRATLANWMIRSGKLIQPLINLLRDQMLDYDIIQMDETTVQVLKEPDKRAQSKSYIWLQRGGPPGKPVVLYDYDPGRSSQVPKRLLEGFSGYLQTDGYDGYNAVVAANGLVHLGCMAHARRRFNDAVKAQGRNKKRGQAHRGLSLIRQLYRVETLARKLTVEERYAMRQQQATPIIKEIREWLKDTLPQISPSSATGKALSYLHNEWRHLTAYLKDGRLEIDNNGAENAIRPFVLGRKNWLFSTSVKGVKSSTNLYSLIETAKANALEPYAYLRYIFTELPKADTVEAIEAMLPTTISMDQIQLIKPVVY
ncbi:MAG: IS66 family transposase [Xanthomonadales bacterium]|nr:IS66 family transposase [Xanthomonadales bacterium]